MSAAAHSQGYSPPEISWLNLGGKIGSGKLRVGVDGCFQQQIGRTSVIYSPLLALTAHGVSALKIRISWLKGGAKVVSGIESRQMADRTMSLSSVCVSLLNLTWDN